MSVDTSVSANFSKLKAELDAVQAKIDKQISTVKAYENKLKTLETKMASVAGELREVGTAASSVKKVSDSLSEFSGKTAQSAKNTKTLSDQVSKTDAKMGAFRNELRQVNKTLGTISTAKFRNDLKAVGNASSDVKRLRSELKNIIAELRSLGKDVGGLEKLVQKMDRTSAKSRQVSSDITIMTEILKILGSNATITSVRLDKTGNTITELGIDTKLTGNRAKELSDALRQLGIQNIVTSNAVGINDRAHRSFFDTLALTLAKIYIIVASIRTFVNVVRRMGESFGEARLEMQRIEQVLLAATKSTEKAGAAYQEIRDKASKYGLDLKELGKQYSRLRIAADTAGIAQSKITKLFDAVARASSVLQLSGSDVAGVMRAFEQMISKGKVQSEELKLQLGDRLPGALALAALAVREVGESTEEAARRMEKMMKAGQLLTKDFIGRFADVLKNEIPEEAVQKAINSLNAQLQRFEIAKFESLAKIGMVLEDEFKLILSAASSFFVEIESGSEVFKAFFKILGTTLGILSDNFNEAASAGTAFMAVLLVGSLQNYIAGLGGISNALAILSSRFKSVTAFVGGPWMLGLAAISGAVIFANTKIVEMGQTYKRQMDQIIASTMEAKVAAMDYAAVHDKITAHSTFKNFEAKLDPLKAELELLDIQIEAQQKKVDELPKPNTTGAKSYAEMRNENPYKMAKEAEEIDKVTSKLERMQEKRDKLQQQMAVYEMRMAQLQERYGNLTGEIEEQGTKSDALSAKIARLEAAYDSVKDELKDTESAFSKSADSLQKLLESVGESTNPLQRIRDEWNKTIDSLTSSLNPLRKQIEDAMDAAQSLAEAELEAADSEAERIKILSKLEKEMKDYEKRLRDIEDAEQSLEKASEGREKAVSRARQEIENEKRALENNIKVLEQKAKGTRDGERAAEDMVRQQEILNQANQTYDEVLKRSGDEIEAQAAKMRVLNAEIRITIELKKRQREEALAFLRASMQETAAIAQQADLIKKGRNTDYFEAQQEALRTSKHLFKDLIELGFSYQIAVAAMTARYNEMMNLFEANQIDKQRDKWLEFGRAIASAFDDAGSSLGNLIRGVVEAASALRELGQIAEKDFASAALGGLQFGSAVGGLLAEGGGQGKFGGQLSGNYALEGGQIGGVVGAIAGAIIGSYAGMTAQGAQAGAAIGGVAGSALGSFIKKGADEALATMAKVGGEFANAIFKEEGELGQAMRNLGTDFHEALLSLEAIIGAQITTGNIGFKIRDDTVRVFVNGIIGEFETLEQAVSFATAEGLKSARFDRAIAEEVRLAIRNGSFDTLEELQRDLQTAMDIHSFGMPEFQREMRALSIEMRNYIIQADKLGISFGKIFDEFTRKLAKTRNEILGIEEDFAAQVRREAESFNAERADIIAQYQTDLQKLLIQLSNLDLGENIGVGVDNLKAMIGELAGASTASFNEILFNLSNFTSAVDIYTGSLGASAVHIISQIQQIQQFLLQIPAQITEQEINQGIARRRSGGGRAQTGSVGGSTPEEREKTRAELRKELEYIRAGFGDLAIEMLNFGTEIEEFNQYLIDLRGITEEEIAALVNARIQEKIREFLQPFLDINRFSGVGEFQRAMTELNEEYDRQIEAAYALAAATGVSVEKMLEVILAAREIERTQIVRDAIDSLGIPSIDLRNRFRELADTLDFLRGEVSRTSTVFNELADNLFLELGDALLGFVDRYYQDVEGFEEFRRHLEVVRFNLEYANLRLQFTLLQGLGILTQTQIDLIEGVLTWIGENLPTPGDLLPDPPIPTTGSGTPASPASDLADELARIREEIANQAKEWNRLGMSQLDLDLLNLRERFDELKTALLEAGGHISELTELERALAHARTYTIREAFSSLFELYKSIRDAGKSPIQNLKYFKDQYLSALSDFRSGKLNPDELTETARAYYDAITQAYGGGIGSKFLTGKLEEQLRAVLASVGYKPGELDSDDPVKISKNTLQVNRLQLDELRLMNGTLTKAEYDRRRREEEALVSGSSIGKAGDESLRREISGLKTQLVTVMTQVRDGVVNTHLESKEILSDSNVALHAIKNDQLRRGTGHSTSVGGL